MATPRRVHGSDDYSDIPVLPHDPQAPCVLLPLLQIFHVATCHIIKRDNVIGSNANNIPAHPPNTTGYRDSDQPSCTPAVTVPWSLCAGSASCVYLIE